MIHPIAKFISLSKVKKKTFYIFSPGMLFPYINFAKYTVHEIHILSDWKIATRNSSQIR